MNKIKKMIPDALAVVFFILIGLAYFYVPTTEGLVLTGHDHTGGAGAGAESQEYLERTGERTRWTNSQFGGMPTYQMSPSYSSTDTLSAVERVYQLGLPTYVMYVFIMLLGFYILLRAFNFKVWMAALGAVVWAFSSYYFIIIAAGHIWKFMALSFIPPTIAGLVLCYRGKYIAGGVVTAFFAALQIFSNHIQMSYYFLSVMLLMALAYLIQAVREHRVGEWFKATGVLVIAGILGVCINLSNLYHTYQYSKESMRSKSELTHKDIKDPSNQTSSGLERDYITQWSYGIGETWTLLVPNTKGGASMPLTMNETAMKKADPRGSAFFCVSPNRNRFSFPGVSAGAILTDRLPSLFSGLSSIRESTPGRSLPGEEITLLPPFLLLRAGHVDRFVRVGVLPGPEHHRREGHRRGGQVLHLFQVEVQPSQHLLRQRLHVLLRASRMR